jgi:serine/threonine protein kinase
MNDYRTSPVGLAGKELIGTGGFGIVTVRQDLTDNRMIAIKHFSNVCSRSGFLREVGIMVKLNHPCVLRIVNWALPEHSIEGEIHTEFASNRSLKEVLEKVNSGAKPGFWNPTGIGILICSLVLGMRYIHWHRIIHHDLKPSNILINGREHVWIGDFGVSCSEEEAETSTDETGTVYYAAPEQYVEGAVCTTKCDVFAFGLVLYEILTGIPVFRPSESPFAVIQRLRSRDLTTLPDKAGKLMQTLMVQCCKEDPADRPSFEEIFNMFTVDDFGILPGSDRIQIRGFADEILAWESRSRLSEGNPPYQGARSG